MLDKNGKEIKTGDIVKIEGGYFKADNGTFLVKHTPGDPSWNGSDYCLHKCNKKGIESESKYSTAFWPLMVTVSSREKGIAAKRHNKEHATIEIIGSVKVYELIVKQTVGWNDYETREIATEKRYNELLNSKYTKVEVISESVNEQKAELPVPVIVEATEETETAPAQPEEPVAIVKSEPVINETLARRSKENMSFSDYVPGSATAEFNQEITKVSAWIEAAKASVSPEAQAKLDRYLESFKTRYANWINNRNRNGAGHVSVMIAGPSNYNMRKHEKYLNREGKLWEEYEEFKDFNIQYKINSIVAGDRIIKSGDADAIEKLQAKIEKLEKHQENMKAANAIIRKKKLTDSEKIEQLVTLLNVKLETAAKLLEPSHCCPYGFPSYELTNNNANIRTAKQRLEKLQRDRTRGNKEIVIQPESSDAKGIRIVDNVEAARLQIFFPGKPDAEVRTQLKKNGFRWTPSIGAWQAYRSERANQAAKEIASNF